VTSLDTLTGNIDYGPTLVGRASGRRDFGTPDAGSIRTTYVDGEPIPHPKGWIEELPEISFVQEMMLNRWRSGDEFYESGEWAEAGVSPTSRSVLGAVPEKYLRAGLDLDPLRAGEYMIGDAAGFAGRTAGAVAGAVGGGILEGLGIDPKHLLLAGAAVLLILLSN